MKLKTHPMDSVKKFSRIYIEITNVCNLSCSFCVGNSRYPKYMSAHEFSYVLNQVKLFTDYIYLHVLGEPLLHPQLNEILSLSNQAGVKVNITTNGTLLAKRRNTLLNSPALRKVSVSLHSMEDGSTHFGNEYLEQVCEFAKEAADSSILCGLRLWNLGVSDTCNGSVFEKLCRLFKLDDDERQAAKIKMAEGGSMALAPKIFLETAHRFLWPSLDAEPTNMPVFCHGLRNQAAILCNGTVVPCCLDSCGDVPLGNVFNTPLGEILESPRAKAIYDGFSVRCPAEELCRRCGYAVRF